MNSRLLSLIIGAALTTLSSGEVTILHYRLNDTDAAGLPLIPSVESGSGIAQAPFNGVLSEDVPTIGVPEGAGNRSIVGAFSPDSSGVNSGATQELLNAKIIDNGGFTFEAWFKWDGINGVNPIIDYAGTEKIILQNETLSMLFDTGSGSLPMVSNVPSGEWHYIAVVFEHDGEPVNGGKIHGTMTWYYDGLIPLGSVAATKDVFGDSLNRVIGIGRHPMGFAADNYAGLIYEPRVSLGALTAQELLYEVIPDSNPQFLAVNTLSGNSDGGPLDFTIPIRNQFGTTLPLEISAVTVTGPNAASYTVSSFPSSIAANGGAGDIEVNFTPSGDGVHLATLTIESNDPNHPTSEIALSIDVRDPAVVFDSQLDFGTLLVPENLVQSITVGNEGGVTPITFSNPVFSGPGASAYSLEGTLPIVDPGITDYIDIRYAPTTGGAYLAELTLDTNDPRNPQITIQLRGYIQDPQIAGVDRINFGSKENNPGPSSEGLFIDNYGASADLVISSAQITGPAAANYSIAAEVPMVIAPGDFKSVPVSFDPGSAGGSFFAILTLTTNDPVNPVVNIPLIGRAVGEIDINGQSLLSHWTFDDPQDLGKDNGPLKYDGTVAGDATHSSASAVGSGALLLDGVADYIEIPIGSLPYEAMDDDGDGFTIAAWANSTRTPTSSLRQRYFSRFGAFGGSFGVGQDVDRLVATTYGVIDYLTTEGTAPPPSEWHHFAYVFTNSPPNSVSFYLDGVLVSTVGGNPGLGDTTAPSFAIGGAGGAALEYFHGMLDDLRVYGAELQAPQIAQLFDLGSAGPVEPLFVTAVERVNPTRLRIEFKGAPATTHLVKSSTDLTPARFTGEVSLAEDGLTTDATGAGFIEVNLPAETDRLFFQIQAP